MYCTLGLQYITHGTVDPFLFFTDVITISGYCAVRDYVKLRGAKESISRFCPPESCLPDFIAI